MTCMYKDYKFKIKMVREQWLDLYENCYLETGEEPLMRGNKNLVEGGYCRIIFSSRGMNKILAHVGTPIFS